MEFENDITRSKHLLIRSKLERPRLPERLVPRPRLLERLDGGLHGRLTLIAAPAGYGKTTVTLQWLSTCHRPAAWITFDRGDRDPNRFATYLVAALRGLSEDGFQKSRALLEARAVPPWSYFCDVLTAELEQVTTPTVLVLEDYHAAGTPSVHELVERMIERLPPTLHLVVTTRVDPPWPLTRWRTRGWFHQVRARDLCFSVEETTHFFASFGNLTIGPATVELLQGRTEGWIAGLRLAQLSLSDARDPDHRARELTGTDRQIADYLMEEVLADKPPDVIDFLAASALLERFTAPLMDHLLAGRRQATSTQKILVAVERENLFLVALDNHREWFRWHHLFRDLLLDHLNHPVSPEFRRHIDCKAGVWFAQQGLIEEALRHLIGAGELDAAAELVGANLHSVMAEDMSCRLLSRWLAMFPGDAVRGSLPLLVADAYQRIVRWDLSGLEERLRETDRLQTGDAIDRGEGRDTSFRSDTEAQWSFLLYWQGDVEGSLEHAQRALDSGPKVGTRPWSLSTLYRSASLVLTGQFREAIQHLDEAVVAVGPESPNLAEPLVAQAVLNLYALEFESCRSRAQQLFDLAEHNPLPDFWMGHAPYLLGAVAYEHNDLDQADACFRRVEGLRYIVPSRLYQDALLGRALVALARNDEEGLAAHSGAARAYATEVADPTSLGIISSFELRLAVLRGRSSPPDAAPPPADDHQSFWLEVPTVTWAMRLIAHPAPRVRDEALPFIDDALARMERFHNRRLVVTLSVLRALALDVRGRRQAALDSLEKMVRCTANQGLVRTFVDCGPRMKELLDELARGPIHDERLDSLRAAFPSGDLLRDPKRPAATRSGEMLTYRELETLELLAWRMTNKEIASRLAVSSAAVKKRLESIYAKLDVHDRRRAVAEAAARGLIDPSMH